MGRMNRGGGISESPWEEGLLWWQIMDPPKSLLLFLLLLLLSMALCISVDVPPSVFSKGDSHESRRDPSLFRGDVGRHTAALSLYLGDQGQCLALVYITTRRSGTSFMGMHRAGR